MVSNIFHHILYYLQLQPVPSSEMGMVQFKSESIQMRVSLHPTHLQCLVLKVTPLPDLQNQWDSEELQIVERFFENKVRVYVIIFRNLVQLCSLSKYHPEYFKYSNFE